MYFGSDLSIFFFFVCYYLAKMCTGSVNILQNFININIFALYFCYQDKCHKKEILIWYCILKHERKKKKSFGA